MQRFVVTGANKGIGLAVVKGILDADKAAFVFLGSRDPTRGQNAVQSLVAENSDLYSGRVEALQIDVSDDASVSRAVETVRARMSGDGSDKPSYLAGLINNAGLALTDFSTSAFETSIDINFYGVVRTTEAFLPLLDPSKGRIVITSSSSGPSFVGKCSVERQAFLTNREATHAEIRGFADECLSIARGGDDVAGKFAAAGLTGATHMAGYGVTKALVNMYTMQLAREHPSLVANSCTPGFIATDLAEQFMAKYGKRIDETGAKPPSEGAKVIVYLATGDVPNSGWYFGSDCQRSPLDRYREPGSPAYDGK